MSNSKIILRAATMADADLLLKWRNDPQTRQASHNVADIPKNEHLAWLEKALSNKNRRIYIAEEDGIPVGTVRADSADGFHELSWTVAPEARGRSIGKKMVALLAGQISEPIRAEVKPGNSASVHIAESAGMIFHHEENGVLHFRREAHS